MPDNRLRVAIVGGGIGGLSAANALVRRGLDITIFEQVDTLREIGTGLSLFPNGRQQLERMGLKDPLARSVQKSAMSRFTAWTEALSVRSQLLIQVAGMASMECTGRICPRHSQTLFPRR